MEPIKDILGRGTKKPPMKTGEPASIPEPKCRVCDDWGSIYPLKEDGSVDYSRVVPCACQTEEMKKRRAENLIRYCQLPERTDSKTFETFKPTDDASSEAKTRAHSMAMGAGDVIFLTLLSDTGRGKSHLAIAICREWLKRGEPAMYAYVPEMLDDIRASYRRDETTGEAYSQLLDRICEVPLLVLDDLGTENKTPWATEKLQTIIDHRSRSALPMVVTTNKPLDRLPNDDEGRISSRLQREEWCKVVIF